MSHRCSCYALDVLEQDRTLPSGARTVLLLVAARANLKTSATYTGEWLQHASGLTRSQVWRVFKLLTARGYIALQHRPGKSSVVGFPVFGFIGAVEHHGRTDDGGQWHPAFCGCDWCQAA